MRTALAAGLGLGLLVAAQVGPIWLLCARTALRGRLAAALSIAVGAATVDFLYACLGVAGAAQLLRVTGLRLALGVAGASVLVILGARTLRSPSASDSARSTTPICARRSPPCARG